MNTTQIDADEIRGRASFCPPMRFDVRVWVDAGELCSTSILPPDVAETISAAVSSGLRHGAVYRKRRRGLSVAELYCWEMG